MSERTSYAAGTPSWIDLGTPDTAASAKFYGGLFGWSVEQDPRPEAGGYCIATIDGKSVAGLGPQMNPGVPPFWSFYVTVDDAKETLQKAADLGGSVVMGPMEVLDAGVIGVIQDTVGSFVSVWQPINEIGAQLVNEFGTFVWNELATTDLDAANAFYTPLFGWGIDKDSSSDAGSIFTLDGEMMCGAHAAGNGEHRAWSIWFSVDDCDASAALVTELGGSVIVRPSDMDFGRGAVVVDPQGAVFGIGAVKQAS